MPELTVRSQTLKTIVERAVRHEFAVPDMQRDFRWGRERIRSLLASVIAGHPIGVVTTIDSLRFDRRTPRPISLMSRGVKEVPKQAHVLDGQQRLVALLAGFRGPRGKGGADSPWFESRVGAYGWRVDLRKWIYLLRRSERPDFQDAELIEKAIRASNRAVIDGARDSKSSLGDILMDESEKCRKLAEKGTAFELPLWYLLRRRNDQSGRDRYFQRFMDHASKSLEGRDDLFAQLRQRLDDVIEYKVPVARLKSCTARRAAQIFRRMNQQGLALTGSDLACSQFFLHDEKLRGDMRILQQEADLARASLSGIYEDDILWVSVCASGEVSAMRDLSAEALVRLVDSSEGVGLIRSGFNRFRDSIRLSSEILGSCGVASRERWPIDSVTIATLAAIAVHREQFLKRETEGVLRKQVRRWWWAEHLRQAGMPRRIGLRGLADEFGRLHAFLGATKSDRPKPDSLVGAGLAMILTSPRGAHKNSPGPVITKLVECALRAGKPRLEDWFSGKEMGTSSEGVDLHHVFPKAWAKKHTQIASVESVLNLTLMGSNSNRNIIRDKGPNEIFSELLRYGQSRDAGFHEGEVRHRLESHGIAVDLFLAGDYPGCCEHRLVWLDRRLKELLA